MFGLERILPHKGESGPEGSHFTAPENSEVPAPFKEVHKIFTEAHIEPHAPTWNNMAATLLLFEKVGAIRPLNPGLHNEELIFSELVRHGYLEPYTDKSGLYGPAKGKTASELAGVGSYLLHYGESPQTH